MLFGNAFRKGVSEMDFGNRFRIRKKPVALFGATGWLGLGLPATAIKPWPWRAGVNQAQAQAWQTGG